MRTKKLTYFLVALLILLGIGAFVLYISNQNLNIISNNQVETTEDQSNLTQEEKEQIAQEEYNRALYEAELARIEDIKEQLRTGVYKDDLRVAFLTFDDGPNEYSSQVLDILAANDVKATFFPNGRTDPEYVEIYQRIVNEGHALGNHTFSHNYSNYNNTDSFISDVLALTDYERQITGVEPAMVFRFPGGSNMTNSTNTNALLATGYNYFDWTTSAGDGGGTPLTAEQTFFKILTEINESPQVAVILTHAESPNNVSTREALEPLIQELKKDGYTFLPLEPEYNLRKFI